MRGLMREAHCLGCRSGRSNVFDSSLVMSQLSLLARNANTPGNDMRRFRSNAIVSQQLKSPAAGVSTYRERLVSG